MRTLLWSYPGWKRFPREMSAFEVRRFFSLTAADGRELRVRYPRKLRLGAALGLGFVRMTGTTLDAFNHVPRPVLEHVAGQLDSASTGACNTSRVVPRGAYALRSSGMGM